MEKVPERGQPSFMKRHIKEGRYLPPGTKQTPAQRKKMYPFGPEKSVVIVRSCGKV